MVTERIEGTRNTTHGAHSSARVSLCRVFHRSPLVNELFLRLVQTSFPFEWWHRWVDLVSFDQKGTIMEANALMTPLVRGDHNSPRGTNIGNNIDGIHLIEFRHERQPHCWFNCGVLGHDFDKCPNRSVLGTVPEEDNLPFGSWLKASQGGRRLNNMAS
ncbi:cysteine desulfurase mitochondrial-like [Senna tora]|uniref:Cysteine desulfurase mitochondrial-like n=1 Tax=Senna tora TaxID=362788 RepID=A0A834WMW5_9FABA|nr:cysteine desulfurase mitochondrial-like [Senna tora]